MLMNKLLANAALVASVGAATLLTGCATGGFPNRVHYINHDKVAATFVKGGRIIEDEGLTVIANRGVQRGSEVHAKTNHVFIIVDGEADFITGGTMIEPRETAPGQIRGKGIEGGTVHRLTKGDVITIPANTPHQWKDTSKTGSVGYYAVNIEQ
jgi:mannose-6-phosphate isomerase-like protein (cupin superfamily)